MGFELDRTAVNSGEVARTLVNFLTMEIGANGCQKPINYGDWPKSRELARTLTPDFVARDDGRRVDSGTDG